MSPVPVSVLPDMAAHIVAMRDVLAAAGVRVHIGEVHEAVPALPYALLAAVPGVGRAVTLSGGQSEADERVRVTVVDDDPLNCLRSVTAVRRVLDGAVLDVPARTCFPLRLMDSMPVTVDQSVTRPGGRHPCYAVDSWRVASTPTTEETP